MLELKNVSYKILQNGQEKTILDDVSCVINTGDFVAITGQNGSGKSTLTKAIMGIIKINSGKIFYNGKDITNLSIDKRAKLGINYAFQQPVMFSGITIKDLIDMASGRENSVIKACEYLSRVGLCAKEYINREFNKTLSGGEQKRIELALALAKKGNCLIFDEPEAGIDLFSFEKLGAIFDSGKTNIVVSHQEKLLKKANIIIVMENGKIKDMGRSKDILKKLNPQVCGRIAGGR